MQCFPATLFSFLPSYDFRHHSSTFWLLLLLLLLISIHLDAFLIFLLPPHLLLPLFNSFGLKLFLAFSFMLVFNFASFASIFNQFYFFRFNLQSVLLLSLQFAINFASFTSIFNQFCFFRFNFQFFLFPNFLREQQFLSTSFCLFYFLVPILSSQLSASAVSFILYFLFV